MMKETNPISAICLKWIKILENSSAEFLEDTAYKFGLFFHKKTKRWTCGSPSKPIQLTESEAIQKAEEIRNDLVKGAEIISSFRSD